MVVLKIVIICSVFIEHLLCTNDCAEAWHDQLSQSSSLSCLALLSLSSLYRWRDYKCLSHLQIQIQPTPSKSLCGPGLKELLHIYNHLFLGGFSNREPLDRNQRMREGENPGHLSNFSSCCISSVVPAPPSGVLALAAWPDFHPVAQTLKHDNTNSSLYTPPIRGGSILLPWWIFRLPSMPFWLFGSSITHVTNAQYYIPSV